MYLGNEQNTEDSSIDTSGKWVAKRQSEGAFLELFRR